MLILMITYGIAFVFVLLGITIVKISRKKVKAIETPEVMYERATDWQKDIMKLDDMLERVKEDEKWCQYVKKIKGRKNGLKEV